MPIKYSVKPFQPEQDDPAEIARLHLEVRRWQQKHQNNIFSDIYESQRDLNTINAFYIENGGNFFVARDPSTDRIAGFVGLKNEGKNVGRLMRMAVMEEYRRQGIGSVLVETAVSWARDHGYVKLVLGTGFKENAKPIYEKAGFAVVGTKNGKDWLMECDLTK